MGFRILGDLIFLSIAFKKMSNSHSIANFFKGDGRKKQ